jgi:hypothetical protein
MQHMQELYMSEQRGQPKQGINGGNKGNICAVQATPGPTGYCPSCGTNHATGCKFMTKGTWDIPAYIEWIVGCDNPDRMMKRVFAEDWPRSTLHRSKGDREQMDLQKLVQARRACT